MPEYEWESTTPQQAAELLRGLRVPWWVAGGWAIDLFLRTKTRTHGDMDIALLRGTEPSLRACLPAWDIQIAHDGEFIPWNGGQIVAPYHQFWARRDPGSPWALEFMLEEHTDGMWVYRRNAKVTLPIERFGRSSKDGVPYIAPEVALLYKARGKGIERNAADFEVAITNLSPEAKEWLRDALTVAHAGHPWTKRLR